MKKVMTWLRYNRPFTILLAGLLKRRLRLGFKNDAPLWLETGTWLGEEKGGPNDNY